jgi:putative heme-binding domain-containing protein
LASRAAYAKALVEAVANKQLPAADLNADIVRQINNFKDKDLNQRIYELWGTVRETADDRKEAMKQVRRMLGQKKDLPSDLSHGRMLYSKTCAQCHTLFGVGEKIGPDITGSNRANIDYLLENILDPSAVVPKEYRMTVFDVGGRQINGIVKQRNANVVTVQTANGPVNIQVTDIDDEKDTPISLMPEGQLKPMSDDDVRSLLAYLQSPGQVPMEATAENAKDFFNGKDLTGWDGDPKLWSVENGEIVGRSPGLKRNEFLKSHLAVGDFRLKVKVKLTPNKENSGIQFRSEALSDGEMKGYQADIGKGWWGKLYEENGRALLWKESGEKHVKENEWNDYEVVAEGSRIKTYINGQPCVDFDDPPGARKGVIAFQLHSGGALEVRFKDLKLELLSPK